jgi:hypothetical protein
MFSMEAETFPSRLTIAKCAFSQENFFLNIEQILIASALAAGKALMAKDGAGVLKNLMEAGKVRRDKEK